MTNTPSPELVTEAFYRLVQPDLGVTTKLPPLTVEDPKGLPKDNWGGKKFWITPRGLGIGRIRPVPVRQSLVRVDVWGKPVDRNLYWGRTQNLAQELLSYCVDWYTNVSLPMPYQGYHAVSISSITGVSDTRKIDADPQGLARFQFDLEISYSLLSSYSPPPPDPNVTPGGSPNVVFIRSVASTVWSITHELGYYPHIELFDTNWNEIEGAVHHLNENTFVVEFNQAVAGYAVVG